MVIITEEEKLLKRNKHFNIAWLAASQRQLTGVIAVKNRIGRDTIQAYNTSRLCQLILENESALKFKTKAQLLYGASKIMRQQSHLLYDDSTRLWSKLKSDMLNPTESSFIDMDKTIPLSSAITLSEDDNLLQFQTSVGAPLFSSLFDHDFNCPDNTDNEMNDASFVLRVEYSRNTSDLLGQSTLDMPGSSTFQEPSLNSIRQQQLVFDDIDMGDLGGMDDYDMMDYDVDVPQQELSGTLDNAPAEQGPTQDDVFDFPLDAVDMQLQQHDDARARYVSPLNQTSPHMTGPPNLTTTTGYYSLDPNCNASGPPSLIQEEEEEQDNLSVSSVSTGHLSTIFPLRVVNVVVAPRRATGATSRRMRRMVSRDTMLSYTNDYSTERILRSPNASISLKHPRSRKLTMARLRNILRYPSVVFDAFGHNTVALTEQGVGQQQQHEELTFFNRTRVFYDQIEKSRRYDRFRRPNTSGSLSSQYTATGVRRLSHQVSSGGVSIRSNSDVHNTPEMHNIVLDGEEESDPAQENTMRWQQQQFEAMNNDDMGDYGGDDIDFTTDINVGFDADLLQPQQQTQEDYMQAFMEQLKQLPNPFVFNTFFQAAQEPSTVAKLFSSILELASKGQIRVSQTDSFGPIEVLIGHIP